MLRIFKYGTGEAPPNDAVYLNTVTQTMERDPQPASKTMWRNCFYVWHYFLVDDGSD